MANDVKSSVVRLFSVAGTVVGAGFLIDPTHVLTCAHVVTSASGGSGSDPDAPDAGVRIDFPLMHPGVFMQARVVGWHPLDEAGGGMTADTAVLQLDAALPAGAEAATLARVEDYWGRRFRAFGFPAGYDEGQWASGLLRDRQAAGWVQIEDVKSTGYFVAPGFSGTPVWDEDARGIVGMVVGSDARSDVRAAFMIPTTTLLKVWPSLEASVAVAARVDRPKLGQVVELVNTPAAPDLEQVPAEKAAEFLGQWLIAVVVRDFFEKVQIVIDKGSSEGVKAGDYFAVLVATDEVRDPKGDVLGSLDQEGALIRAVDVRDRFSVCQLSDWAYGVYFDRMPEVIGGFGDEQGFIDLAALEEHVDVLWPIRKRQLVLAVSSDEKYGRTEVEDLYGRTLDEGVSEVEKRFLYREMVRKANAFLLDHPNGYFASSVLYQRGYAQFQLEDYEDAIETFELFLRRYPFSVSAEGARNRIEEAREALKRS